MDARLTEDQQYQAALAKRSPRAREKAILALQTLHAEATAEDASQLKAVYGHLVWCMVLDTWKMYVLRQGLRPQFEVTHIMLPPRLIELLNCYAKWEGHQAVEDTLMGCKLFAGPDFIVWNPLNPQDTEIENRANRHRLEMLRRLSEVKDDGPVSDAIVAQATAENGCATAGSEPAAAPAANC